VVTVEFEKTSRTQNGMHAFKHEEWSNSTLSRIQVPLMNTLIQFTIGLGSTLVRLFARKEPAPTPTVEMRTIKWKASRRSTAMSTQ